MLNQTMLRKENVASVALLQNDCSEGGLNFSILGDFLYFIEAQTIYKVDLSTNDQKKVSIYQSNFPLRHLTTNQVYIAVIEEGEGLTLIEVGQETPFCTIPEILEHYCLYDEVVTYNVGLDVYFINMERDMQGHLITVDQPITQIMEDEEMLLIQMEHSHFHKANKLLYHFPTDETEIVGNEVKFIGSKSSYKIYLDNQTSQFMQTDAMEFFDYGNAPTEVWQELKSDTTEAIAYYHEENDHFACYFQDGSYWIAQLGNLFFTMTKLDAEKHPEWFAVIGSLVVYFDGALKWTRMNH